jgi:hypothetical protein
LPCKRQALLRTFHLLFQGGNSLLYSQLLLTIVTPFQHLLGRQHGILSLKGQAHGSQCTRSLPVIMLAADMVEGFTSNNMLAFWPSAG